MTPAALALPADGNLILARARIPAAFLADPRLAASLPRDRDEVVEVDIRIEAGRIAGIAPAGTLAGEGLADLAGRHVWPMLVDVHTHLDKGHTIDRAPNPTRDFVGARTATTLDRMAHWSREDLMRRMEFGLAAAEAHGVAAIRTHLDSHEGQAETTWEVFDVIRRNWAGRIQLQAVGLAPIDVYRTEYGPRLADIVAGTGGILGGVTRSSGGFHGDALSDIDGLLDTLFGLARERDLDVDLHVDEAAVAASLGPVARATIRNGYQGRVTCGHCCSLALLPEAEAAALIALVAEAGISVVTLPTVNLYLQDRKAGRTPRWRGVTAVHELATAGVRVAIAGDNCRDPFYAYGDHDMLDTFRQSLRIAHLEPPFADAAAMVGPLPAAIMGLEGMGSIAVGHPANLMILHAFSMDQVVARPQSDRVLIRAGRRLDVALPSYALLETGRSPEARAPGNAHPMASATD